MKIQELILILEKKRADAEREAEDLRRQAERLQATADGFGVAIEALRTAAGEDQEGSGSESSCSGKSVDQALPLPRLDDSALPTIEGDEISSITTRREIRSKELVVEVDQTSEVPGKRKPKDMRRSVYRRSKGYVVEAKEILDDHPEGLHIDDLVDKIFDTRTVDEFIRAKNSLLAELNRGVREDRLGKDIRLDVFFAEPKSDIIPEVLDNNSPKLAFQPNHNIHQLP